MGVGSNPTACFVMFASILTLARMWLEKVKEVRMEKTKSCRKAKVKSEYKLVKLVKSLRVAFVESAWAIMASFAAGLVTPSIYAKGAPHLS